MVIPAHFFICINHGISLLYFIKEIFWDAHWYHSEHVEKYTLYIERKARVNLYIYNDKILKGTQDFYREADTPYKMPVSCSLGLRCYPVLNTGVDWTQGELLTGN